jgi:2-keto-4-pentenoate hydratase
VTLGAVAQTAEASTPRELFVRHARKDSRSIAILRALEDGSGCRVETEVYPALGEPPVVSSCTFADVRTAVAFVTEAVEALMYLGCDVQAE